MTVPLVSSTQPGYTLLRGQGAIVVEDFRREGRFSAVTPEDSAPTQSSISISIPGTSGGFGSLIAAAEAPRRFELSDISLFVSLAQTLGAAIERSRAIASSSAILPGPTRSSPPNSKRRNNRGRTEAAGRFGGATTPPYAATLAERIDRAPCAIPRLTALTTALSVAVTMFGSSPAP